MRIIRYTSSRINLKMGDIGTVLAIFYFITPIAVQYIKFFGILTILFIWFAVLNYQIEHISRTIITRLFVWIIVYFVLNLLLGSSLVSLFKTSFSFFLFIFPAILYLNYQKQCFTLSTDSLLAIASIAILIGSVNTILVLDKYPLASRVLAAGDGNGTLYASMGAGGYGFVYGVALLIPCAVKTCLSKGKIKKIYAFILVVVCFWMLIKASYTIALFVVFFGSIFAFSRRKWHFYLLGFIILICLIMIDENIIGDFVYKISRLFPSGSVLRLRFADFSQLFYSNDLMKGTGNRFRLYEKSLTAIRISPIFGGLYSGVFGGGHTSWLDLYANYGFFSLVYIGLIIYVQKTIYYTIPNNKKPFFFAILVVFWGLGLINPIHTQMMVGMSVFFVIPLWLRVDDGLSHPIANVDKIDIHPMNLR